MNTNRFPKCSRYQSAWPCPASETGSAAQHALQVSIRTRPDDAAVMSVCGDIDIATAPLLVPYLQKVTAGPGGLVLDLTRVPFLGCVGMALLDTAASRTRRRHAALTTVVQPQVRRILHRAGLDTTLACCDTVDEALAVARRACN